MLILDRQSTGSHSLVTQRLLSSGPPHRHDDEHGRGDTGLASAEDEAEHQQAGERGERRADHARRAPAEEAGEDPIVDRETDEGPDGD